MEKSSQRNKRQSGDALKQVDIWTAQCGECFKWRTIPTVEEYEEIRSKIIEDPFICSKKDGVTCEDPADIEYNNSRTWLLDKPNLPKTPVGFKRRIVIRRDFSRLDCYYDTPNGRVLRASTQVGRFLSDKPVYNNISVSDFSFTGPKIMEDTLPPPLS
ncbi:methyl-CpG-binding domain-containing protein 4-like [Primulina huaijiensis]|uniref:methyl-CpG-binding domain-containing protein 4-like n=1 Tax=Primulina huaijiensis TaxID=1492673 RepID=UPI003CC73082